ncbi:hypothetical protein R6Q57_006253 [Mikania cordata]
MMANMDINDFVQKLKEQEIENKWKAKRVAQVQDPSLYYYTPTVEKSSSHVPLKTTFVSQTSFSPVSNQVQFSQPSSSSSSQQESSQHVTSLKTENFDKVTVEIAKEHMGLLSTLVEENDVQFAMMENTSTSTESDQVDDECSSSHSKCYNCVDLETKIELLNRQLHEAEIVVLNKQDAINSYLNTINEIKKKLAMVECDYETLGQKLKSYKSSSYIIEHMISKGTDLKGKGKESYQHCPSPILNSFVNSPDDKDVKDFQVKTPLVIDPIGMITEEGSSLSEESFVEGIVEDWVSDSKDESDVSSDHVATQNKTPVVLKGDPISSSKVYQALSFVKASKENEACVSDKINNLVSNGKKGLGFNEDKPKTNVFNHKGNLSLN